MSKIALSNLAAWAGGRWSKEGDLPRRPLVPILGGHAQAVPW